MRNARVIAQPVQLEHVTHRAQVVRLAVRLERDLCLYIGTLTHFNHDRRTTTVPSIAVVSELVQYRRRLEEIGSDVVVPEAHCDHEVAARQVTAARYAAWNLKLRVRHAVTRPLAVQQRLLTIRQTGIRRLRNSRRVAEQRVMEEILAFEVEPAATIAGPLARVHRSGVQQRPVLIRELRSIRLDGLIAVQLEADLPADRAGVSREPARFCRVGLAESLANLFSPPRARAHDVPLGVKDSAGV